MPHRARSTWAPEWACAHGASTRGALSLAAVAAYAATGSRGWAVGCDGPQARRGQQWVLRSPSVGGVGVPHVDGLVGNVAHGEDEGVAALRIEVSREAVHGVGNVQALLTSHLREQRQ